ncbi:MAG TPA: YidB family protein [Rhodopila sp.]
MIEASVSALAKPRLSSRRSRIYTTLRSNPTRLDRVEPRSVATAATFISGFTQQQGAPMSILGDVIGGLLGGSVANSPLQGVLINMLSGQSSANAPAQGYAGNPVQPGGVAGLVSAFEQAGLGHIVQSWIGTGPNQPVSPSQLQSALGENQVQSMASQSGMAPNDFLSQLSQHLPTAVDRMTPNGRLPDEGTVSV